MNTGNAEKILLSNEKLSENHRRILEGKDFNRYITTWGGLWINYDPTLKKTIDLSTLDTRQNKIDFSLRNEKIFVNEKIIIRQTSDIPIATYDNDKFITRHSIHIIYLNNDEYKLKSILALINSKLIKFYYKLLVPESGKTFAEVKIVNLKQIPIKPESKTIQEQFVDNVDQILLDKKASKDTQYLEDQIDLMVYKLYELTYEEVLIVDPECPFSKEEYEKFELEKAPESEAIVEERKTQIIPEVAVTRKKPVVSKPVPKQIEEPTGNILLEFTVGQQVIHPTFGEGEVQHVAGRGKYAKVFVKFGKQTKKLVAGYAKLRGVYDRKRKKRS